VAHLREVYTIHRHKVGYFTELMSGNEEIDCVGLLLKLSRETIHRSQKLDYALVSSLERDPLLVKRLKRLRTVPGVGLITALTWVLGDRRWGALPIDQTGHQLLRTVRSREEVRRQGRAHAHFQAAQQAYPAGVGRTGEAGTEIQP